MSGNADWTCAPVSHAAPAGSRRRFLIGLAAVGGAASWPAGAQQRAYPTGPVRLVVGYGAGTAPDFAARTVARKLQENWTAGVVVDNRAGGGGTLAVANVLNAPPDGLTLLWGTVGEMAIAPAINRKLSVDPGKLRPIIDVTYGEMALVVNPGTPVTDVREFLSWAKDKKPVMVGTFGPGSPHHLFALMFGSATGLPIECVHYKGAQEFASDLRAGLIHAGFASIVQARTWQGSNSVKIAGIAGTEPSRLFPDIQTFKQAGLEKALFPLWSGLFGPPGLPDAIASQVHAAAAAVLNSPEVDSAFKEVGNRLYHNAYGTFEARVQQDRARFVQLASVYKLAID
jgi:tripartite-type tricarboxylate transporter receptor subunit TctC